MKRRIAASLLPVLIILTAVSVCVWLIPRQPRPPRADGPHPAASRPADWLQTQARAVLDSWTYPGIHVTSMSGALGFRGATREFDVSASPVKVWEFYSRKSGYISAKAWTQPLLGMCSVSSNSLGSGNIIVDQAQPQFQTSTFFLTTT